MSRRKRERRRLSAATGQIFRAAPRGQLQASPVTLTPIPSTGPSPFAAPLPIFAYGGVRLEPRSVGREPTPSAYTVRSTVMRHAPHENADPVRGLPADVALHVVSSEIPGWVYGSVSRFQPSGALLPHLEGYLKADDLTAIPPARTGQLLRAAPRPGIDLTAPVVDIRTRLIDPFAPAPVVAPTTRRFARVVQADPKRLPPPGQPVLWEQLPSVQWPAAAWYESNYVFDRLSLTGSSFIPVPLGVLVETFETTSHSADYPYVFTRVQYQGHSGWIDTRHLRPVDISAPGGAPLVSPTGTGQFRMAPRGDVLAPGFQPSHPPPVVSPFPDINAQRIDATYGRVEKHPIRCIAPNGCEPLVTFSSAANDPPRFGRVISVPPGTQGLIWDLDHFRRQQTGPAPVPGQPSQIVPWVNPAPYAGWVFVDLNIQYRPDGGYTTTQGWLPASSVRWVEDNLPVRGAQFVSQYWDVPRAWWGAPGGPPLSPPR